jgi:anhydro-N-acetylmuramic acid kinase
MLCVGLISGTSMDAVDAALVRFDGVNCELLAYRQGDYDRSLALRLRSVGPRTPLAEIVELDAQVGEAFASCALELLASAGIAPTAIDAIGTHGQTLHHAPGGGASNSLQVGDPNRIAYQTGIRTIADFRRMDMAAGGQGAPLAPAFHAWRFAGSGVRRAILNIGGIANLTILPESASSPVTGFDTGPGNVLLDCWIGRHSGQPMDRDAHWANAHHVDETLLQVLLADPYLSRTPPKSTGREYFNLAWIDAKLDSLSRRPAPGDVQRTLLEMSAASIARAVVADTGIVELLVCGGGVHNPLLMQRLASLLPGVRVESTSRHGVDPDAVEAMLFAWLANRRLQLAAGNLPSVTGAARAAILGAIYEPATPTV